MVEELNFVVLRMSLVYEGERNERKQKSRKIKKSFLFIFCKFLSDMSIF